ncbi:TRAP transporter substrate-binding protein [Endozoicomonas lisbonensis]|uniref:C4-dicarboxylate-binding protein DctP n=1 Tax=Endozoicomonas lisbonensis TaxID=3120522 RepID=A0ABV2SI35_9GAMM
MIKRIITAAALILSTLAASAFAQDPIVIKFSHVVAENTPKGQMANKFRDLVHERLGDRVKVEVYPNSQLYGDNKVLEAMLLGDVQMGALSLSKFKRYTKKLQVFDLPFLLEDLDAVYRFENSDTGKNLLRSMERRGILGLGYLHSGMKQFSANKPLRVPEDAAGLKFRIMSSDVLASQMHALNATPLKKPFSEVFTLLQTKAIDGQENSWSNIYSKKFYETQEYITQTDHGIINYMIVTSDEFWKGLPADLRGELQKAIDESIDFGNAVAKEKATSDRVAVEQSGRSKVLDLTPEERKQWVEAMRPVWKEFERDIGKDVIEAALKSNG